MGFAWDVVEVERVEVELPFSLFGKREVDVEALGIADRDARARFGLNPGLSLAMVVSCV
jgi:hypothetical protein